MEVPQIIKHIDKVLDALKSLRSTQEGGLITYLNLNGLPLDKVGLNRLLIQLFEDKYIYDTNGELSVSVKGYLFSGYERQLEVDNEKLKITEENENLKEMNENRLIVGTWFAGFAALLLFVWQVFVYVYPLQSDFYYFWWQHIPIK